jgi:hypothetical protein
MSALFAEIETSLGRGDLGSAADSFSQLRPIEKSSLNGLKLAARIHAGARRWELVDVICRVMRKEFPTEIFGFTEAAESLHQQGRHTEATDLLNLRLLPTQ